MQLLSVRPLKQMLHKLVAKGLGHLRVGSRLYVRKNLDVHMHNMFQLKKLGALDNPIEDCPIAPGTAMNSP